MRTLLELVAERLKGETRLEELTLTLVGQLDRHAAAMVQLEGEVRKIRAAVG